MTKTYVIYQQYTNGTFNYEHAWRILKDQPQYKELLNEGFSKRYNPDTLTSFEHDSTTPLVHSIGKRQQKEEQTKIYEKFF